MDPSTCRIDQDPHERHKQPLRGGNGHDNNNNNNDEENPTSLSSISERTTSSSSVVHPDTSTTSTTTTTTKTTAATTATTNSRTVKKEEDMSSITATVGTNLRPGAVSIGATVEDLMDDVDNEDVYHEGSLHLPIAARLAPDYCSNNDDSDNDIIHDEHEESQVEARIQQEVEDRIRQREESILVVVAAEAPSGPCSDGCTGGTSSTSTRRNCILAILFILLVLGGAVGGVGGFLLRQKDKNTTGNPLDKSFQTQSPAAADSNTTSPTMVPSSVTPSIRPIPLDLLLVEELQFWIIPTEDDWSPFRDPTSPQSQALVWLQDDPLTLTPGRSTRTVLQRYVLAVLYFATSGPTTWKIDYLRPTDDVCAWNDGFPPSAEAGKLHGVYCHDDDDGGIVYRLDLPANQLVGQIPWELGLLTNLTRINLDGNALTGTLSTRLFDEWTQLEAFWVYDNRLTGTLPAFFSTMTRSLDFDENQMTGSIPDTWGTLMPGLTIVALSGNRLTGTLPGIFGSLVNLTYLDVSDNLLTGTVPSVELSQSTSLEILSLAFNSRLTGSMEQVCGGEGAVAAEAAVPTLEILEADCDQVDCPCCTTCCYEEQCESTSTSTTNMTEN